MSADGRLQQRRALEALRSGVPNRDAVRALGSARPDVEGRFTEALDRVRRGEVPRGLVVAGDFGSGKSHLLEYLRHLALDRGFAASKVVISKETPLHDPAKVFRAAVSDAAVPDRRGPALPHIAARLDFESSAAAGLRRWVAPEESGLNERFAATLFLFEQLRHADPELAQRIVRFWAGDPLGVGEIKRALRQVGAPGAYSLPSIKARDLAVERFRFAARLVQAAGYGGWVLLFDEVELVGRYTRLQRARSYPEVWRFLVGLEDEGLTGIVSVMAFVADFAEAVIRDKNDDELAPAQLRARGEEVLAARAELAMKAIETDELRLRVPDEATLDETYRRLREIHAAAYEWQPPELARDSHVRRSMREYVRAWIYEWDLRRLDPSYAPQIEFGQVGLSYAEDDALETPSEGSEEPGET